MNLSHVSVGNLIFVTLCKLAFQKLKMVFLHICTTIKNLAYTFKDDFDSERQTNMAAVVASLQMWNQKDMVSSHSFIKYVFFYFFYILLAHIPGI